MKIMPCVVGDKLDCQNESNSNAQIQRLREILVVLVVEGWQSDLSSSKQGIAVSIKSLSFTPNVYLFTLGPFRRHKLTLELVVSMIRPIIALV